MSQVITSDNPLFIECVEALNNNIIILSEDESDSIWRLFNHKVPVIKGGSRIDWEQINKKNNIDLPTQIITKLKRLSLQKDINTSIYILWNDASLPVLKSHLDSVLKHFDDVTCVGFETWFFNPSAKYIIEYYYLGDITAGLID